MSRICVKNLPRYVVEDRLRDVFSQKGEVTDAKIMRTKDGRSRQFAFIGYRTEAEAEEAIKFFNNTFLDTCRITCEVAYRIGDPDIPRPWSRYSSRKVNMKKEGKVKNVIQDLSKNSNVPMLKAGNKFVDPKLEEFIQIMEPRVKTKVWANDILDIPSSELNNEEEEAQTSSKEKKVASYEDNGGAGEDDLRNHAQNRMEDSLQRNTLHELACDELVSDLDYFKSRVNNTWPYSENRENDSFDVLHKETDNGANLGKQEMMNVGENGNIDKKNPPSDSSNELERFIENGRLFVRNLPFTANEEDLEELFCKFGSILDIHLVLDKDTKQSKGTAYVLYTLPESAFRALQHLDNSVFQGRLLHVMIAEQPPSLENKFDSTRDGVFKTFKMQREQQKKASEANGDSRAWNSLFMRSDTVVDNITRKCCISKSDLLDREADNLAVRIALGEAQVIAETKQALANAGVNVESLEKLASGEAGGIKRSTHVLLVKNLPYSSTEVDLSQMFGKFGSLDKIVLPSTKTLALVVFLEAVEARAAFKGLMYKRYKDAPLYLEWAPVDILSPCSKKEADPHKNLVVGEKDVKKISLEKSMQILSDTEIDSDRVESWSVFVKNLNFKTTDESLKRHFSENMDNGKIQSVKIKKHMKRGKYVSMGFGFIEFDSVETATNIFRDLQGTVLDGHALILQLCRPKKLHVQSDKSDEDRSSTKLIVRNIAFEATKKDLRELFSSFGQIKSLRLPKKLGGHRGFAFVEYATKKEAQSALQALSNTHLFGRHLVFERAKDGESLEELRTRTAVRFFDEQCEFQNEMLVYKKRKLTSL